jgi:hypothetical protein
VADTRNDKIDGLMSKKQFETKLWYLLKHTKSVISFEEYLQN